MSISIIFIYVNNSLLPYLPYICSVIYEIQYKFIEYQ